MLQPTGLEIAIIGMAGRFPGARSVEELWQNLRAGVESISFFSTEELLEAGIDPALVESPSYVRARGALREIAAFDAGFFGYSPREARMIDPQQRLFLECAWAALEDAGYDPLRCAPSLPVGVYAGASMSDYLAPAIQDPRALQGVQFVNLMVGNDKDHLSTRVSYKLGLEGPSLTIQTACSTSLVAVHVAAQALLNGECDMALAGGVSARLPENAGYPYEEGMILSPDGHCRAFGAGSKGTVPGHGLGVVVLRRLADALAAGDSIRAVLKGTAINNDGSQKVGYTAPRIEGQARVIRAAQIVAGVSADSITYVEAHGTGTPMGDPIEVAALTRAFRATTERKGFCALGSVKTNLGHLDTAAGVTGLIKAVLALQHREIPPTLHADPTNPEIDFANSPFYISQALHEWPAGEGPRRAAVSSFGMGGTNAHVILEEAPPAAPAGDARPHQLLVLSARTEAALATATDALADHLERHSELDLADVAYTCQVGRHGFTHRRGVVVASRDEAVAALRSPDGSRRIEGRAGEPAPVVAFLFPGQGVQHLGMGAGLYASEPLYRQEIDACCEILVPILGIDPRRFLMPAGAAPAESIASTALAQPLLFVVEHALARLLGSWGVVPAAMIGHSVGEYVAACLAGVFSREDALRLVAARGALMQRQPAGAMLAVPLAEEDLEPLLSRFGLALAAVNAPASCVAAGPGEGIAALESELAARGLRCRRLHTSHAFHSAMMDGALAPFAEEVARVELRAPSIPYLSNRTGIWIRPEEATDPSSWVAHLRSTVRFSEGVAELLRDGRLALVEVGPGQTLATLVRKQMDRSEGRLVLSTMRHPDVPKDDSATLLEALGRLWAAGAEVDWPGFSAGERRRRIPLPTYPFERQRYQLASDTVGEGAAEPAPAEKSAELKDRFHLPVWRQAPLSVGARPLPAADRRWLIFLDGCGLGARIAERLAHEGARVLTVEEGDGFERCGEDQYVIAPGQAEDHDALLADLESRGVLPTDLIHAWSVSYGSSELSTAERLAGTQERGFWSLLSLAQALGRRKLVDPLRIGVLSNDLHCIAGEAVPSPEKATLLGPCLVLPNELPGVSCQSIDVVLPPPGSWQEERLAAAILDEISAATADPVVAYRGGTRWLRSFSSVHLDGQGSMPVKDGGVYLITGGLGALGLDFAELLARQARVRLALVGRSGLSTASASPVEPQGFLAASPADDRALVRQVEAGLAEELQTRDLDSCGDLVPSLDALCASYALDYLTKNGGGLARGERRSRSALREALGILPKFHRFYDYLLAILEEDGVIRCLGDELTVLHGPEDLGDPRDLQARLVDRFPEFEGLLSLVAHCAANYGPALRGEIEAIGVLYPDGERRLLDEAGRRTASQGGAQLYASLAAELTARAVERARERPLRVLEVGAGSGLLTRHLIDRLRSQNLEYWFTDISRAFVLRAEQEVAQRGLEFLRFATLDISQDPVRQGFAAESFDFILGLDVVHATKNVIETTSHLRRLLAPGGTLALVEQVRPYRWIHLVWGLAEGWWAFADDRRTTPLLSVAGWEEILRQAGYTDIASYPGEERERSDYALLTGRSPLVAAASCDLANRDDLCWEKLQRVRQLEALGAEVMVCAADVADPVALESAIAAVRSRFGRIDGVLHAAGVLGAGVIQRKSREAAQAVLAPKVAGTLALERLLSTDRLEFFLLCSSTSSLSGLAGQVDYCAANAFLDSFAHWSSLCWGRPVTSINWERWTEKGMAVKAACGRSARPAIASGRGVVHPLLQRLIHESSSRFIFAARLGAEDWILDEHRLLGLPVVPGTAYLEMARAACEEITGAGQMEIRDVVFWSPLVVPDGECTDVYTVLDRVEDGFELQVVSAVELEGERRYRRHASATVLALANGAEVSRRLEGSLLDLWSEPETEPPPAGAVETGPRWRVLRRRRSHDMQAVGTLRLDARFAGDLEAFKLHPALLDVATSLATGLHLDAFYAPLSYLRLRLLAPLPDEVEVMVQVQPRDVASASPEVFSLDVAIADREGQVLVEIDHFTKKRIEVRQDQREALAAPVAGSPGLLSEDLFPEIVREPREHGIHPRDGVEAMRRILAWNRGPQIAVIAGQTGGARTTTAPAEPAARIWRGDGKVAAPRLEEGPEATLARIWCEVLGIASVGAHDNFFELGGDSILGLQVVARAKAAGLHLKTSQIFEQQTINALVGALATESASGERPAAPGEPAATAVPALAVPPRSLSDFPLVQLDGERRSRLERRLAQLDGVE